MKRAPHSVPTEDTIVAPQAKGEDPSALDKTWDRVARAIRDATDKPKESLRFEMFGLHGPREGWVYDKDVVSVDSLSDTHDPPWLNGTGKWWTPKFPR